MTRLEGDLKRALTISGKDYTLTLNAHGLKLTEKGRRIACGVSRECAPKARRIVATGAARPEKGRRIALRRFPVNSPWKGRRIFSWTCAGHAASSSWHWSMPVAGMRRVVRSSSSAVTCWRTRLARCPRPPRRRASAMRPAGTRSTNDPRRSSRS